MTRDEHPRSPYVNDLDRRRELVGTHLREMQHRAELAARTQRGTRL